MYTVYSVRTNINTRTYFISMAQHGAVRGAYEARHNKMPFLISVDCRRKCVLPGGVRVVLFIESNLIMTCSNPSSAGLNFSCYDTSQPPPRTNSRNPLPFWGINLIYLSPEREKVTALTYPIQCSRFIQFSSNNKKP
jgi:hypothetical protein